MSREVKEFVVYHKNRFVRFDLELIELSCQQTDCQLVVLNRTDSSSEREMVAEFVAIFP